MNRRLIAAAIGAALALAPVDAGAEGRSVERGAVSGNGLEIIVCADDAAPVEYVNIVFKAGAESLDAGSAGSLSLLERLILRGLRAADSGTSGRLAWEGYATAESVGFRVAVPASSLAGALSALASVLKSPPLDPESIEEEKEAAIAGIRASASDPDAIYEAALNRRLFSKYPWRRDPAGSEKSVRAATAESLSALAAAWLAPGNAALALGGPASAEAVLAGSPELLSDWKDAPGARRASSAHPKPGVARPTWLAYPDPSMPEGAFSVELRYRGPDAGRDPDASAAADLFAALAGNPSGRFASSVLKELAAPAPGGLSVAYTTQREGGTLSFSALFRIDPASPAAERARDFKERVRGFELTDMRADLKYCPPEEYAAAKAALAASRESEASDPGKLADAAAFWWSVGFPDYFTKYAAAVEGMGPKEMSSFIDAYVMKNLEIVAVRINPADYDRERASFSGSGFETISAANAFWWPK